MTGIVLCEISSGLVIEPRVLPSAVVGDSTEVLLTTTGAVGTVEFGFAPPGHVALEPGLPPGRTLTDNNDGTATISGTFTRGKSGPFLIYAWDAAGQIAEIRGTMTVAWNGPVAIFKMYTSGVDTRYMVTGGVGQFETASWSFDPPLPAGWHDADAIGGGTTERVVVGVSGESWSGRIIVGFAEGWPAPGARQVHLDTSINL